MCDDSKRRIQTNSPWGWTPDLDRNWRTWFFNFTGTKYSKLCCFQSFSSYSLPPSFSMILSHVGTTTNFVSKNFPRTRNPRSCPIFASGVVRRPYLCSFGRSILWGIFHVSFTWDLSLFHFFQSLQLLSWKQARYLGRKVSLVNKENRTCLFHGWGWRNSFSFHDSMTVLVPINLCGDHHGCQLGQLRTDWMSCDDSDPRFEILALPRTRVEIVDHTKEYPTWHYLIERMRWLKGSGSKKFFFSCDVTSASKTLKTQYPMACEDDLYSMYIVAYCALGARSARWVCTIFFICRGLWVMWRSWWTLRPPTRAHWGNNAAPYQSGKVDARLLSHTVENRMDSIPASWLAAVVIGQLPIAMAAQRAIQS